MKNKVSFVLMGVVIALSILACDFVTNGIGRWETVRGSGTVTEENRDPGNFSSIRLSMEGTLHLSMGSSISLQVEAEDNLLEYIETNVMGGRLVIETRQGINLQPTKPIHYSLTVPELNAIEITSSGDVEAGDLQSDSFSVEISSSGDVSIRNLVVDSVSVRISSSGDVSITNLAAESISVMISSSGNLEILGGQVEKQDISISSSGEYRAGNLASAEADVTLTSSGDATLQVSDRLSGRLSSSGNLYYIGNPNVNVRTTSSGNTTQIKE